MTPNPSYVDPPMIADERMEKLMAPQAGPRKYRVFWLFAVFIMYNLIAAFYGMYLLTSKAAWPTVIFNVATFLLSALSACAGAHRLWSHRSYKATAPLQVFLMLCHCLSGQQSIFFWARYHRLHHRYSDTDADPHNATRGFFYSHVGWTCVDRHPEVNKRMRLVDMSDLLANPIVMFQNRYRYCLSVIFTYILPTLIPMYFWNETILIAFHANIFRFMLSLNGTFSINSFAHLFGTRPYDKNMAPRQNIITGLVTFGEGFHNYHHAFPYDYKAGELGSFLNLSTTFIDLCAKLGLAYDLREASKEVLQQRMSRTGDESTDKYGIQCWR